MTRYDPTRDCGALPPRPPRRMPTMLKIAKFHGLENEYPHCFKCFDSPEWEPHATWRSGHGLVRAHVIDRFVDGLDIETNLRPLCESCHRLQPIFEPGDEEAALAWFNSRTSAVMEFVSDYLKGTHLEGVLDR